MGRQHALTGLLAGVGIAALIPAAPLPIRALAVIVTGGASLLPDLDHPSATAARSLGLLTKTIAKLIDRMSLVIYHATREPGDPAGRASGHRLFTHTVAGCLLAGVLAGVLTVASPVAGAVACGLLAGLLGLGLRVAGFGLASATGGVAWFALTHHSGWWWLVPLCVAAGCVIHICGDAVTNTGVPLLWPLVRGGQRWGRIRTPVTFEAGGAEETRLVAPALVLGLGASVAQVTGVLPVVVQAAIGAAS